MNLEQNLVAFLAENPNDPMVLLSLGSIYMREERFDEAVAVLERAVIADPNYMAAYPALGECRERLGEVDKARDAYTRALELAKASGDRTMTSEMTAKLESQSDDL
jgi:Flp pilus assembly protein TadD